MFTDFEFNGQRLSNFGCMVCGFDSGRRGVQITSMGSNLTLNTMNNKQLNKFNILSTTYKEPYTARIQICKHTCDRYNRKSMYMDETLISGLMRWLNKKRYCKFKMLYDGRCSDMYFNGTFPNIQMIKLNEEVVGLELTFQADAPFGYYKDLEFDMDFSDPTTEFRIYDMSDEEGYIYPSKVKITVLQDGDLEISNSMQKEKISIKNCVAGEIIVLNGKNKIIQSDAVHPKLHSDFNYYFLKIVNKCEDEEDKRENIFTVTLPCHIHFSYAPICKSTIIK